VFFFQAEDGIRDRNVTGVQTCALPICAASTVIVLVSVPSATVLMRGCPSCRRRSPGRAPRARAGGRRGPPAAPPRPAGATAPRRSEERRVGKERSARERRPPDKEEQHT